MSNYNFQYYIKDGEEHFVFDREEKSFPFPENLLRILYLDMWKLEPMFKEMDKSLLDFMREKEWQYAQDIISRLNELAQEHVYFEFLCFDWQWRLEETMRKEFKGMHELLPRKQLRHIPSDIDTMQKQIMKLFETVLDINKKKQPMGEKLELYFESAKLHSLSVFDFQSLQTCFERVGSGDYAEVLHPTSIKDFIDFSLRECIKREISMRICKSCGRYFAVTGRINSEYCSVTRDKKGRTCKEIGAIKLWNSTKGTDEIFKIYRREYKKRFAWIKAGRIAPSDFLRLERPGVTEKNRV